MFDKLKGKKQEASSAIEDQDPVPPYPSNGEGNSSTESDSPYPPQPYHDQAPIRTLKVEYSNLITTRMRAYDITDPSNILYTADIKALSPHMLIKKAPSETPIADVKFHYMKTKVDIAMTDKRPIALNIKAWQFKPDVTYESPALNGEKLTWKVKTYAKTVDIECRDEKSLPLAHLFTTKLSAKLDFFGNRAVSEEVMDELIVTGLALGQYMIVTVMLAIS